MKKSDSVVQAINEADNMILHDMGYKQELHRGLNAFSNFAIGYTEVAVLCGICSMYDYGLETGGPSAIFWGWVIAFTFTMFTSYSLAEICSAYPCAGSVYHWAGQLAPENWAPLVSYICGWTNFLGNALGDASFAYTWASFLSSALITSGLGDSLSVPSLVIVSISVLFLWSLINCLRIDQLAWLNGLAAVTHCGSTVLIMICLLSSPQLSTTSFVLTGFHNSTGFTSTSYVYSISLLTALWSFSGYEASAQFGEETSNSQMSAPSGIVWTVTASGIGGIGLIASLLFATNNISEILNSSYNNCAIEVLIRATGPNIGCFLAWIIVLNIFFAGMSSVSVTSRITYALSRDGAFPFSNYMMYLHPTLKSPIMAIVFVWVLDSTIQMLPLISEVAFLSITSTATIGFQVSYAIPILMKLLFAPKDEFHDVPYSLGKWSIPCGSVATVWLLGTSVLFFLPTEYPITYLNMNYSIFIVSTFVLIGAIYWQYSARFFYRGPKRSTRARIYSHGDVEFNPLSALNLNGNFNNSMDEKSIDYGSIR